MSATRAVKVVLDGPPTPAWQARALSNLIESPLLGVVAVELAGEVGRSPLQRLHDVIERRLLRLTPSALAAVSVDCDNLIAGAAARAATLTIWLSERLAPNGARGDLMYLRHACLAESADRAFRRAVADGAAHVETELLLRRTTETVVVDRTVSPARPFSATASRDLALWKLAALVVRAAERLPGLDLPAAASRSTPPLPAASLARAAVWPRMLATRLLFRRPWSVRVRRSSGVPTTGWSGVEPIVSWTPGHIYADPFLFEHQGRHHLFCEEIRAGTKRGVISHTELRLDGGVAEPPAPVLQLDSHLSYPFVFTYGDAVFMIPETVATRRVELYRATEFPYAWELDTVLFDDLRVADATLLLHDERIWLFAAVAAPDASLLDELHLFWADTLRGPWHPHPRNPIVSDVRGARPGGAVQRWGSRLVRVGQDGSRRYGGAISFREIDVLSRTDYAEHEIARLEAGDVAARATHTYSADSHFEAIDVRRRVLRLRSTRIGYRGSSGPPLRDDRLGRG